MLLLNSLQNILFSALDLKIGDLGDQILALLLTITLIKAFNSFSVAGNRLHIYGASYGLECSNPSLYDFALTQNIEIVVTSVTITDEKMKVQRHE